MKIIHSAVKSPVYELVRTLEVDVQLGDEFWPVRFELFRNTESEGQFRCRIWQAELFKMQPTFPQAQPGVPKHDPAEELLWVEFNGLRTEFRDFPAANTDAALQLVLAEFKGFLEQTTGKRRFIREAKSPT